MYKGARRTVPSWIDGEVTGGLAPLAVVGPDASLDEVAASSAVQLFRERAGARAQGALDTERACRLFGEICRRVDGVRYFFFVATCLAATAACFFRLSSLVLFCF